MASVGWSDVPPSTSSRDVYWQIRFIDFRDTTRRFAHHGLAIKTIKFVLVSVGWTDSRQGAIIDILTRSHLHAYECGCENGAAVAFPLVPPVRGFVRTCSPPSTFFLNRRSLFSTWPSLERPIQTKTDHDEDYGFAFRYVWAFCSSQS